MVGLLKLIAFIFIVSGIFYSVGIGILEFVHDLSMPFYRKKKLRDRVLYAKGKKKQNGFAILISDTKNILTISAKTNEFPKLCALSMILALGGLIFGMAIANYLLAPILCVGMCTLPFIYIKIIGIRLKKQLNDELETALSIITSSYIRSEDIITAIEENKEYINPPVKDVFDKFVLEAKLLSPDIKRMLSNMKDMIDNEVFREWCDAIIACQEDGSLKSTLLPIVKKLSNIRLVSARLDALLYEPVKEYATMVGLLVFNIPLMYFINKTWFHILLYHNAGKMVLALSAISIFISSAAVIRISKPIEYKR